MSRFEEPLLHKPLFKNEGVFNPIPLNPPLSGWSFAFGGRLSVTASFSPGGAFRGRVPERHR